MGFWQSGPPGFGFRRLLMDENRVPKFELAAGQRKSLQTERVVLVPGPASELELVRRIFRSFVTEGRCETAIAANLNAEQVPNALGNCWQGSAVHDILVNEKYAGNLVFNRSSRKLRRRWVANPPEIWIRRDGAFPPIVEPDVFAKAQAIMARRREGPIGSVHARPLEGALAGKGAPFRQDRKSRCGYAGRHHLPQALWWASGRV